MQTQLRDNYIRKQMRGVTGYLRRLDATIISTLLGWQENNGVKGNLCEIGVHHGRLFLILALSRREKETSVAIDLFEDDDINTGEHAGRAGALLNNAKRLNIQLSADEVMKGSSMDLTPADILKHAGGPIRFFSVDGGHMYEHVENDLKLAKACMSEGGIIAVDDFFNLRWSEVSFATYDFLRVNPEYVPCLATNTKLYLVDRKYASKVLQSFKSTPPAGMNSSSPIRFLGSDIFVMTDSRVSTVRKLASKLIKV